jgi:hypothetical protein
VLIRLGRTQDNEVRAVARHQNALLALIRQAQILAEMRLEMPYSDAVHRDLTFGSCCDRNTSDSPQLRSQRRNVPEERETVTTIGLLRVTTDRVAGTHSQCSQHPRAAESGQG